MTVEQTCVQVTYSFYDEYNNTHIHCYIPQLIIHHTNRLNLMATCMLQVKCVQYMYNFYISTIEVKAQTVNDCFLFTLYSW